MSILSLALAIPLMASNVSAANTDTMPAPIEPVVDAPALVFDASEAETLGNLTASKLAFLKPKRARLPQNPYGSIDFTAYALEWGETRMGVASISVGILPRVQLGTMPVLDAIGVYNASAKANLLRVGPVDLAVGGAYYTLPMPDFSGSWTAANSTLSVRVLKPWSVHVTGSWVDIRAEGSPSLSGDFSTWILTQAAGDELANSPQEVQDRAADELANANTWVDAHGQAVTLRVATDVRFNRRDSLVLQGQAMMWGRLDSDVSTDLPAILGLDEAMDATEEEDLPIAETFVASAAWQMQWKRLELRIGAGISSVPGAWLLQSTDLAWRFGGKTRSSERRVRQAWRRDRRTTHRGGGDAMAAAPTLDSTAATAN